MPSARDHAYDCHGFQISNNHSLWLNKIDTHYFRCSVNEHMTVLPLCSILRFQHVAKQRVGETCVREVSDDQQRFSAVEEQRATDARPGGDERARRDHLQPRRPPDCHRPDP